MLRLGEAEGEAAGAGEAASDEFILLSARAELGEHPHEREIADDGVLVLQVVVQAELLLRQVLADHRQPQLRPVLAAELRRGAKAPMARRIGRAGGLAQQGFPLVARQAARVPIGAGVFAAVVEEADVVVLGLQRLDLSLDEGVELAEVGDEVVRQVEIHQAAASLRARTRGG